MYGLFPTLTVKYCKAFGVIYLPLPSLASSSTTMGRISARLIAVEQNFKGTLTSWRYIHSEPSRKPFSITEEPGAIKRKESQAG
jgi:hypothetical protein